MTVKIGEIVRAPCLERPLEDEVLEGDMAPGEAVVEILLVFSVHFVQL